MASKASPAIFKDLKILVNDYLASAPIKAIGPYQMYKKSLILIGGWTSLYTILLAFGPTNPVIAIVSLAILLALTLGLEFCIMHDASHFSFSSSRLLNKIALNFALGVIGGCSLSWHQEHVVRHHGHTNIFGEDPDVYGSHVLRLHPEDQWHWWQKWQHFYAIPLYSFMWVHWFYNDIVNALFNTYNLKGKKYWQFWMQIFIGIVPHVTLGLVIPYMVFQDPWLVGIGYCLFFMILSIVMAMTFVLAHVSDGQEFYLTNELEQKDWALHQLETTADFAVDNPFLTWILGGLNFQVEHHIFPSICHLHYPAIQKIVKKYCNENHIPYREEKTLGQAVLRHITHLRVLSVSPKKKVAFSGDTNNVLQQTDA